MKKVIIEIETENEEHTNTYWKHYENGWLDADLLSCSVCGINYQIYKIDEIYMCADCMKTEEVE